MPFQVHKSTIFDGIISRYGVQPDPWKLCVLIEMPPPNNKKLQSSPSMAEVCEPLWRFTAMKSEWIWNNTY